VTRAASRALVAAIALLSGLIGFLVGRASPAPERAEPRPPPARVERATVELEPEAYAELQAAVERGRRLETEMRELRGGPAPEAPPVEEPGTRREDGTIVGGAQWAPMWRLAATSYLLGKVDDFFGDANLTEHQKQRLKAELEQRLGEVMQIGADFTNGDIDGDQAYAALDEVATKGRAAAAAVLDDRQLAKMQEFEKGIADFNRTEIVNNEVMTLQRELGLDPEQQRLVRPIVEERYRRVQERFGAPLPNFMFKPIRRAKDDDIYAETGRAIREYLRPEQRSAFDVADAKAATAIFEYRPSLVPR
jgi:hypothetical protein